MKTIKSITATLAVGLVLAIASKSTAAGALTPIKSVICGDKRILAVEIFAGQRGQASVLDKYVMGQLVERLAAGYIFQEGNESHFVSVAGKDMKRYRWVIKETKYNKATLTVFEFPSNIQVKAIQEDNCTVKK